MSPTACADSPVRPSVAELNALIRQFTAGRLVWSPDALAELAVLREAWRRAVDQEAGAA